MKTAAVQGAAETLNQTAHKKQANRSIERFQEMLENSLKEVNELQLDSNKAVRSLAAGKHENIHETMIAMEKASVSFQMMMQIRNRIIDAYQEILKTSM